MGKPIAVLNEADDGLGSIPNDENTSLTLNDKI